MYVCVCVRSILKATLATSYKKHLAEQKRSNPGDATEEEKRQVVCKSHSPCAVFVRVILVCGSRCL